MVQDMLTVLWNRPLGPGYYRIGLTCPDDMAHAVPGQFVMLGIPGCTATLLHRPFSIHRRMDTGTAAAGFEILYQVVGPTTRALSEVRTGQRLHIIGPLGRGFDTAGIGGKIGIAAGGVGVAPLLFLAEALLARQVSPSAVSVFIGGRTAQDLLCVEDFAALGMTVTTTTDDGSAGDQCLVTHPLDQAAGTAGVDIIFACGPPGMLACVAGIAEKHAVPCQISIETMMGCGIGACLGCAVEGREDTGKYLHACLDGPVFAADKLKCNFH